MGPLWQWGGDMRWGQKVRREKTVFLSKRLTNPGGGARWEGSKRETAPTVDS